MFAALRECEALKQTGPSLASTRIIGGISFFLSFSEKLFYVICRSVLWDPGLCCITSLRNRKMGILSWTLMWTSTGQTQDQITVAADSQMGALTLLFSLRELAALSGMSVFSLFIFSVWRLWKKVANKVFRTATESNQRFSPLFQQLAQPRSVFQTPVIHMTDKVWQVLNKLKLPQVPGYSLHSFPNTFYLPHGQYPPVRATLL